MAATIVHGRVNSLGDPYKDTTPKLEIRVPPSVTVAAFGNRDRASAGRGRLRTSRRLARSSRAATVAPSSEVPQVNKHRSAGGAFRARILFRERERLDPAACEKVLEGGDVLEQAAREAELNGFTADEVCDYARTSGHPFDNLKTVESVADELGEIYRIWVSKWE